MGAFAAITFAVPEAGPAALAGLAGAKFGMSAFTNVGTVIKNLGGDTKSQQTMCQVGLGHDRKYASRYAHSFRGNLTHGNGHW